MMGASTAWFLSENVEFDGSWDTSDILAEAPQADTGDLAQTRHGDSFASTELGCSGLATMNIVNDAKTT